MERHMPAEWEAHARTWMAWPTGEFFGHADAYAAWAAVANAIVAHEPVAMVAHVGEASIAQGWLDPRIDIHEMPLDDAWMRDIGPTWVRERDGTLSGVDWIFNGWGQSPWARWENDRLVAERVLSLRGQPLITSTMVNEGGGIHTDGNGTFLLTETVQRGAGRNPEWTRVEIEEELARVLGAKCFVWLDRGLTRDYDAYGTRGHVDIVACFAPDGRVLMHDQRNRLHPDYDVSEQVRRTLTDAGLVVVDVPAPTILEDEHGPVDYSYINHYVCNGAVIMCTFDDPGDRVARDILAQAYPGRAIVGVDARAIFARGGGVHCITQQEPA